MCRGIRIQLESTPSAKGTGVVSVWSDSFCAYGAGRREGHGWEEEAVDVHGEDGAGQRPSRVDGAVDGGSFTALFR
jgi:hypothetical protein